MRSFVLDTSVIVKWYRREQDEPDAPAARAILREHTLGTATLAVPALAVFELGNVLVGARGIPDDVKAAYLQDFFQLGLDVISFDAHLAAKALEMALGDRITYYDACFVALAVSLDSDLVTADENLLRNVSFPRAVLLRNLMLP